jgi:hypothetical protein
MPLQSRGIAPLHRRNYLENGLPFRAVDGQVTAVRNRPVHLPSIHVPESWQVWKTFEAMRESRSDPIGREFAPQADRLAVHANENSAARGANGQFPPVSFQ